MRPVLDRVLDRVQAWDRAASGRVTRYIANSKITQERIARFWGRESSVVHPPVEVSRFTAAEPTDYFLVVTELVRHKNVELALESARRAGQPIKVVGSGPDEERLKARYGEGAHFLGRVPDEELARLYASARALVVPNVEEFGIAAVEAQAAGRPVLAADAGGVQETVLEGVTGVRVPAQDTDAFAEAMRYEDFYRFSSEQIQANADRFSAKRFKQSIRSEVARAAGCPPLS